MMKPDYPEDLKWLPDWTDPAQYPSVEGVAMPLNDTRTHARGNRQGILDSLL